MSAELDNLLEVMLPWQREIYEQYIAAGPGAQIVWQGGRQGGKFLIKKALELREKESKMTNPLKDRDFATRNSLAIALSYAQNDVYAVNEANGWFEDDRTVGDDIALLHSEVSEMLEAYRDGGLGDQTAERVDETPVKPEGFGSEAADVLIRLLDTCKRRGINLAWEFERKLEFNSTRGHKHGGKVL